MSAYQNRNLKLFEVDEAWAGAVFVPESNSVQLGYIQVPPEERKQGLGKKLLEKVRDFAEEREAYRITGTIVSADFLRLSQRFFGDEAVVVERETGQVYPDTTLAFLNYIVKPGEMVRE